MDYVKPEVKAEPYDATQQTRMSGGGQSGSHFLQTEVMQPGAEYTCASCTRRLFLSSDSPMQCPSCEHLTGSSSIFYKVRTEATTYDTI